MTDDEIFAYLSAKIGNIVDHFSDDAHCLHTNDLTESGLNNLVERVHAISPNPVYQPQKALGYPLQCANMADDKLACRIIHAPHVAISRVDVRFR